MKTTLSVAFALLCLSLFACVGAPFEASELGALAGSSSAGSAGSSSSGAAGSGAGVSGNAGSGTAGAGSTAGAASAGVSGAGTAGTGSAGGAGSGAGSGTAGAAGGGSAGVAGSSAGMGGAAGTAGGPAGAGGIAGFGGSSLAGAGGMPPCPTGWTCTETTATHGSFVWDRVTRFGSWYDAKAACLALEKDPAYGPGNWHAALVQEWKPIAPLSAEVMPFLPSTTKIDLWSDYLPAAGLGAVTKIFIASVTYDVEVREAVLPFH